MRRSFIAVESCWCWC